MDRPLRKGQEQEGLGVAGSWYGSFSTGSGVYVRRLGLTQRILTTYLVNGYPVSYPSYPTGLLASGLQVGSIFGKALLAVFGVLVGIYRGLLLGLTLRAQHFLTKGVFGGSLGFGVKAQAKTKCCWSWCSQK